MKLNELTIVDASKMLDTGEITSSGLVEAMMKRIEEVDQKTKSYITKTFEAAQLEAKQSDERRKQGKKLSQIDGIPMALKDVFATKGILTSAASRILDDFIPCYDATVVKRLKNAGCILLGKVNTDEFTMGSSTENSAFGPSHNPWDLSRVPGGSSGGSAVAVAADECIFSLGTDTGGSIRLPSSFCSTVGLKVSYGLVSRYGVFSYASSFDSIGPITKTVKDAAFILNYIAGNDPLDATSVQEKLPDYTKKLDSDIKGKKIGVPVEFFGKGLDPDVARVLEDTKKTLQKLGAIVEDTSLPLTKFAIADYYVLVKSEASSNLSRYDGIKYGHSSIKNQKADLQTLAEVYSISRTEGFGDEAKRSIMMGTYMLSSGYYDAYYLKAMKVRTKIKQEYEDLLKKYDVLFTPVSPFPAFKIGEKLDDPLSMYLADVNTVPINVAGVPAISVPVGFVEREGKKLPVGAQIIGPMLGEEVVLNVSYQLEKALNIKEKPKIQ